MSVRVDGESEEIRDKGDLLGSDRKEAPIRGAPFLRFSQRTPIVWATSSCRWGPLAGVACPSGLSG